MLDIGCGNGQLTRLAARRARQVSGVDLSGQMLATARAQAAADGLGNADFLQADVQVHPFGASSFDIALSRFGVMFFDDPVAAFTNVHRALRPDGRLGAVLRAMAPYLPPTKGSAGPTSLSDPKHTTDLLATAGFQQIGCTAVQAGQKWGRDVADAKAALTDVLAQFAGPDGVVLGSRAWLVTAFAGSKS